MSNGSLTLVADRAACSPCPAVRSREKSAMCTWSPDIGVVAVDARCGRSSTTAPAASRSCQRSGVGRGVDDGRLLGTVDRVAVLVDPHRRAEVAAAARRDRRRRSGRRRPGTGCTARLRAARLEADLRVQRR